MAKSLEPVKVALNDAGLSASQIDDVILVGGQTRMPLVQQKVEEFFGKAPRKDVNPDGNRCYRCCSSRWCISR